MPHFFITLQFHYSVFSTFHTRVFVTNAITFLPKVDEIIVLKDGEIAERGSYEELLTQEGAFAEFLQTYLQEAEEDDSESMYKYSATWREINVEILRHLVGDKCSKRSHQRFAAF